MKKYYIINMNNKKTITISIINEKGGVGKTTSTLNIAAQMAYSGLKVLVIDMDPQGNTSTTLMKREREEGELTTYEFLMKKTDHEVKSKHEFEKLEAFIYRRYLETDHECYIDVIPSDSLLSSAEYKMINAVKREKTLERVLDSFEEELNEYDYVLVDCPPSLGLLTVNAFVACRYLLVPVDGSRYSRDGLDKLINTLADCKRSFEAKSEILGFFSTKYNKNEKQYQLTRNYLLEEAGPLLFETIIHKSTYIERAAEDFQTILEYDPACGGANDYAKLTLEIIRRVSEL